MKKTLLALALMAFAGIASATYCPAGTVHAGSAEPIYPNRCNEGYTGGLAGDGATADAKAKAKADAKARATVKADIAVKANGGTANQRQGQKQKQQQLQSQETVQDVNQNVEGNGFNGDINISTASPGGGSGRGSSTIVPAPIYHGPGVAPLPAGMMLQFFRPCGAQVMVIQRVVKGRETNTGQQASEFEHTWTDVVVESTDGNGLPTPFRRDSEGTLWGSEYYIVTQQAAVGIEGAFSAQVFGKSGGGGLGANAGIALTAPVQRVIVSACKLVVSAPAKPEVEIRYLPAPRPVVTPRPPRPPKPKAPPCVLTEKTVKVCAAPK